jgi:hypothetical protein
MKVVSIRLAGFAAILALASFGSASFVSADDAPICPGWDGKPLAENNRQILHWERTTQNQYRDRGHVVGDIVEIYPDKNGHEHFAIQIGPNDSDRIEVIYNQDFGYVPETQIGMQVEACGDYITSTEQAGPYPPSPDGAIIHWVHRAPNERRHPSGFLMIDGQVYGTDFQNAGPRRHRRHR